MMNKNIGRVVVRRGSVIRDCRFLNVVLDVPPEANHPDTVVENCTFEFDLDVECESR